MSTQQKATPKQETQPAVSKKSWSPLQSLRDEIEQLFDDFDPFRSSTRFPRSRFDTDKLRTWAVTPAMDLVERDGGYGISAELPGMDMKDIEIKLSNGSLVIKGEKREETEEKKEDCLHSERRYGSFYRSLQLPEDVDTDKISAGYANGVLTVDLPKSAEARQSEQKIEVKPG